ncbi:MAG TPA: hypothetical protein VJN69_13945 [Candidatus Acidoferrales bacterium]|nr:hypothetical protein [Candidatus Acidoferrales bacterium]
MLSARPAEWLIARFAGKRRAAAIIGDLLEDASERGPEWFWFSIAGIVLSLTWRYLLALAVGLTSCQILWRYLPAPVFGRPGAFPPVAQPSHNLWPFVAGLGHVCMLLWIAAPYAAVRYGLRDRFAQLALFVCVTLSIAFVCWRIPSVLVISLGSTLLLVIAGLAVAYLRKLLLSLSLALALGYIATQFAFVLAEKYLEWMPPSISHSEQAQYLGILLSAAFIATACELMHRRFFRFAQGSSATDHRSFSE